MSAEELARSANESAGREHRSRCGDKNDRNYPANPNNSLNGSRQSQLNLPWLGGVPRKHGAQHDVSKLGVVMKHKCGASSSGLFDSNSVRVRLCRQDRR